MKEDLQFFIEHMGDLVQSKEDVDLLRKSILSLGLRGKLVPQDPNDEPASVLLEKIALKREVLIKEKKSKRKKYYHRLQKQNSLINFRKAGSG